MAPFPQIRSLRSSRLFVVLVVAAFAVPLAGLALALRAVPDRLAAASPSIRPVLVDARQTQLDGRVPATAELKWADGTSVMAPAWSGIVTAVALTAGQPVRSGAVVARVDEIDRLAVRSPRPFHRVLREGDRGDDVVMLRQVLRELGHPVAAQPQDRYDRQVTQAVRKLEATLTRAPGGGSGVFDPSWLCWLGSEDLVAHEVLLAPGQAAPALGEPIVKGQPKLQAVAVKVADTVRLRDEPYRFHYGDVAVDLDPKRSAAGDAVAALGKAVDPKATSIEGQLRLVDRYTAVSVPVTAVQADAEGGHCLHLHLADGYRTVEVTVLGGGIGTAEVVFTAEGDARVLANPAQMGLACP